MNSIEQDRVIELLQERVRLLEDHLEAVWDFLDRDLSPGISRDWRKAERLASHTNDPPTCRTHLTPEHYPS